ncbi:MAG: SPOR domain-containing protein [Bdellovibrionales bacterium]|nr:SPOR domain-containing protein [Bdellovibrionales bacterium]
MAEKKPIQPLLLFSLIAVLSFSTGVFVGNMVTLYFMDEPVVESNSEEVEVISEADLEIEELSEAPVKKDNKTLDRYKDMLQKSIDESVQDEEFFKSYGIVVGSYTSMEKANNIAIDLKSQYNWELAVYPMDNFHKVVIGPFDNKESAQVFLEQMPKISRFISAQIIEFPSE